MKVGLYLRLKYAKKIKWGDGPGRKVPLDIRMGLSEEMKFELRPELYKGASHGIHGLMFRGRKWLVRSRDHLGGRRF